MSGPPSAINGVLVVGDAGGNVVFADAQTGGVLASAALSYGSLTAPPAIWGPLAFFGEGATSGTSFLHAYDLSAVTIADLWSPGIQVTGSLDAGPVVLGSTLWAVASTGYVYAVGVGDPAHPHPAAPIKVVPGTPTKVSAVLAMPDRSGLLVVTNAGAYGIDTSSGTPTLSWQTLTSTDLTAVTPVLAGGTLLVASGSQVYALAPKPGVAAPTPLWQYTSSNAVVSMMAEGPAYAAIFEADGTGFLLDVPGQASRGTFSLSLPTGGAARTALASGAYVSLPPAGAASANTLAVGTSGATSATEAWSTAAPGFAGPPIVSDTLVYAVATDGTLRVYDVSTGAAVVSASLAPITGSRATVGVVAMGVRGLSAASVQLLLDGTDFFPVMRDLLISVAQGSFSVPARMPKDTTFAGLIKAVGASGAPAYVMAWDDSMVMHLFGARSDGGNFATWRIAQAGAALLAHQFMPGGALWPDQRLAAEMYRAIDGAPGCSAYLEPYYASLDQWFSLEPFELGSNHQKIAIFSVAGTKLALVSGFNVMEGYYDAQQHPMVRGGKYNGHSWHDAGVLLQGPAVDVVEAEFDRRWQKGRPAPVPGTDTYVKVAAWMIQPSSQFNDGSPYQDRRLSSAQVPVRIARTVNERWAPFQVPTLAPESVVSGVQDIRDNLVAAISRATSYVYLENFTFSDVGLTQAIATRLASQPGLKAIVVLPYPTVYEYAAPIDFMNAQNELIRSAYAALLLSSHDWSAATVDNGDTIAPANAVTISYNARGIELTKVSYTLAGTAKTVNIRQITGFTLAATPATAQVLMSSPARWLTPEPGTDRYMRLQGQAPNFRRVYVHSKLALVDDAVAVVGSANFSRRSMVQDGELSAVIPDPATALAMRTKVFAHWGQSTAALWGATSASFAAATTPALGILPLSYSALPRQPISWNWWFLSLVMDPSQLN